jgi:hypothetical protein
MKRRFYLFLLLIVHFNAQSQPKGDVLDSIKIEIELDSLNFALNVNFINLSQDKLFLPWDESIPYFYTHDAEIKFNINLGIDNKIFLQKITKNIHLYENERKDIEIQKNGCVKKIVKLTGMISKNEIYDYEFIYVQYIFGNKTITSNQLKLK